MAPTGDEINKEVLRELGRTLKQVTSTVSRVRKFPATKPNKLIVELDEAQYIADVTDPALEIELYTDGDFHIYYSHDYIGEAQECRWGRHDNPHVDSRDHYHPFPDASSRDTDVAEASYPSDFMQVIQHVLGEIQSHEHWDP